MILVTGASGTAGGAVLAAVNEAGAPHRALYRSQRDAAKAPPGTEVAIGDFADPSSLASALRGVESVYLVCGPVPDLVRLEGNVIDAAGAAGVHRIVLNSALGAADYGKSFPSWHRQVEDRLKASGLAFCVLQPNSFLQNLVTYNAPSIKAEGAFYGAMGESRTSLIDVRDIAAVAVLALAGGHDGQTYILNGPEALTNAEVAERIARHAGVPVRYVDISRDAQRQAMLGQGMPAWQVDALLELQDYFVAGNGAATDQAVAGLIGRPMITVDDFLRENAQAFRPG